jgi:hypothetical protein
MSSAVSCEAGPRHLSLDAEGNLVGDGFVVPRPIVLGADQLAYQTGPWQLLHGDRISFSFEDSALLADAYPYVLDPGASFYKRPSADDGRDLGG